MKIALLSIATFFWHQLIVWLTVSVVAATVMLASSAYGQTTTWKVIQRTEVTPQHAAGTIEPEQVPGLSRPTLDWLIWLRANDPTEYDRQRWGYSDPGQHYVNGSAKPYSPRSYYRDARRRPAGALNVPSLAWPRATEGDAVIYLPIQGD